MQPDRRSRDLARSQLLELQRWANLQLIIFSAKPNEHRCSHIVQTKHNSTEENCASMFERALTTSLLHGAFQRICTVFGHLAKRCNAPFQGPRQRTLYYFPDIAWQRRVKVERQGRSIVNSAAAIFSSPRREACVHFIPWASRHISGACLFCPNFTHT